MVDVLDGPESSEVVLEGVGLEPLHALLHFLVEIAMFLQVPLELLIIELDYLQFLLCQHLRDVLEMALDALDQSQHLLLQVLLPLL
jgi:hypothetical protein